MMKDAERLFLSFTRLSQYIAGLTVYQDIWTEIGKALIKFLDAEVFAFGERGKAGMIHLSHWLFADCASGNEWKNTVSRDETQDTIQNPPDFLNHVQQTVAEALESGFMATTTFSGPTLLSMVFLPIVQENRVIGVMVVGHSETAPFSTEMLEIYLAIAGLAGTTSARLATERELRQHRFQLEDQVRFRTAELQLANQHLQAEIAQRKETETQREKVIEELNHALSKVKKLSGMLPICCYCKKIRDDQGYWNQIESYIHQHSEAEFSHSICRECARKYYPDMDLFDHD